MRKLVWNILSFLCTTHAWLHKAPIVFAPECISLKQQIAKASCGESFILATEMSSDLMIRDHLRSLLQLSLGMRFSMGVPIIQLDTTFTQPYLSRHEELKKNGHDNVVQSLNLVRAFIQGGIGKISHHKDWTSKSSDQKMDKIVDFIETFEIRQPLTIDNYYIGHTLGWLPYEKEMTRNDSISGKMYACSSHFLWLPLLHDNDLIEYLSGIENPLGIVVDETVSYTRLLEIIPKLNPLNEQGKITLLVKTRNVVPLVEMMKSYHVSWCCNVRNLHSFLRLHKENKLVLGGLYVTSLQQNLIHVLCKYWQQPLSSKHKHDDWNHFSL